MLSKAVLQNRMVPEGSLRPDGFYTSPRSFGVYSVPSGRRFRFGNHPIRQKELINECGGCYLVGLFLERDDAVSLARILNSE
jgi:hypothetical protein